MLGSHRYPSDKATEDDLLQIQAAQKLLRKHQRRFYSDQLTILRQLKGKFSLSEIHSFVFVQLITIAIQSAIIIGGFVIAIELGLVQTGLLQ